MDFENESRPYISIAEALHISGMTEEAIEQAITRGRVRVVEVGPKRFIDYSSLREWLLDIEEARRDISRYTLPTQRAGAGPEGGFVRKRKSDTALIPHTMPSAERDTAKSERERSRLAIANQRSLLPAAFVLLLFLFAGLLSLPSEGELAARSRIAQSIDSAAEKRVESALTQAGAWREEYAEERAHAGDEGSQRRMHTPASATQAEEGLRSIFRNLGESLGSFALSVYESIADRSAR